MRDLNPSPGVWETTEGTSDGFGTLASISDSGLVRNYVIDIDDDVVVRAYVPNPDDVIVIRYAGELYRRARAVQVAVTRWNAVITDPLRRADIADRERSSEEIRKAEAGLYALLDEMQKEATDG